MKKQVRSELITLNGLIGYPRLRRNLKGLCLLFEISLFL